MQLLLGQKLPGSENVQKGRVHKNVVKKTHSFGSLYVRFLILLSLNPAINMAGGIFSKKYKKSALIHYPLGALFDTLFLCPCHIYGKSCLNSGVLDVKRPRKRALTKASDY